MAYGGDPHDNPYAAPQEDIAPLEDVGPTKAYGYAGFWLRVVAYLIDYVLQTVASFVIGLPFGIIMGVVGGGAGNGGPSDANPAQMAVMAVMYVVILAVSVGYFAGMESSKYQGTLGKMALGLKVTDLSGRRISFGRATGRFFAKILSGMICLIGYIMVGFTEKKQGLHDMIAGTLVVKTRP